MTGKQAALRLRARVNQLDTESNRQVRLEMALLFLNNAYSTLVKAYANKSFQGDLTSLQSRQFVTDELNHLVKHNVQLGLTKDEVFGEYTASLDNAERYWVHMKSAIKVKADSLSKWRHDPNYKTLDTVGTTHEDPFNRTSFDEPVVYFADNSIKVLADGFTVEDYVISYLSHPPEITSDGEIAAPFVDDIIEEAAISMLEGWESPRAQNLRATKKSAEIQ